jgi:hypothetical protein
METIRAPSQSAYRPNEQNVGRPINNVKHINFIPEHKEQVKSWLLCS